MRYFIPIILIIAAIGVFFWLIDPLYKEIGTLGQQVASFNSALEKSKELQAVRDELLSKYNSFAATDLERLEKMLPDNVDNVRLIMDINNIAARYNMSLKNTKITIVDEAKSGLLGPNRKKYGTVQLEFSVSGPYGTFLAFLEDMEKSLRIVDVVGLSFASASKDFYDYTVLLQTYWLKK
ncbi:MAG: type 4a pilus biogenesis protein PilO [Parcubacteria group bacterium]|nr:type 4a pilus biogenesis protein PilO [Parcubacteria group bacterium]